MTQTDAERVFIALGANLGERECTLKSALTAFEERGDIRVVRCSSFHETDPVGGPPDQPNYLNAVAELQTALTPRRLIDRMLEIEHRHGRIRETANGPRTLDLDLLLFGERGIAEPGLIVPHPRMWEREFVMLPLREICEAEHLAEIQSRTRRGTIAGDDHVSRSDR